VVISQLIIGISLREQCGIKVTIDKGKYDKSSAAAEMGDRLATIGMGRKWGGLLLGLGPHWVSI